MKILWLQPYFPWPCTTGGKTRQYNLLKRLNERGHQITLVTLCKDEPDETSIKQVEGMVERLVWMKRRPLKTFSNLWHAAFSGLPLTAVINGFDHQLTATIEDLLGESWDVIQLEHSYFYEPFFRANQRHGQPFIITEHNVESSMGLSVLGKLPKPLHPLIGLDNHRYQRWEKKAFSAAKQLLAVTEADRQFFSEHFACPVAVIDNGVDCQRLANVEFAVSGEQITFLGNYDYFPNIDAVQWAIAEIFPRIRTQLPQATFHVYGHNCQVVQQLVGDVEGVVWGGFVDDLTELYQQTSLFLCPIRHGGGSKLKTLEAMAAGLPIVATPQAFSGLAIQGSQMPVAEISQDSEEMAAAAIRILQDPARAKSLANSARQWVTEHHDWNAIVDKLEACYGGVTE